MSDSDDDISVSGSEGEDIEMEEVDDEALVEDEAPASDGSGDDMDGDGDTASDGPSGNRWFQKQIWQLKKLPYYDEVELQANRQYSRIKAGLAHAVFLNDPQVGLLHWIIELERYIDQYGRRFPKEDHILFVKLLLPLVKKGNLFRDVKVALHCLNTLTSKRDFLLRGDIIIDWRPLMDLYVEVTYKNLEEDGIFLLPDGFKNELHNLVFHVRSFFSDTAAQEILDEVRPYMCCWDESMVRAYKLLDLFMPMNMKPEQQAEIGSGLWFDEAWHWFTVVTNNSHIDNHIMKMITRLCYECPGYMDFEDKLPIIFSKMLRCLRLGSVMGMSQSFNMETACMFVIYQLGTKSHDSVIRHLQSLVNAVESYLHPSNYGSHTIHLQNMLQKLMSNLLMRAKRERHEKPNKQRTCNLIPQFMRINQSHLDEMVSLVVPLLRLAMFSKSGSENVATTMRYVCSLAPKVVLPIILDVVYPALETVTEPHRLQQALQVLVVSAVALSRDQPGADGKTYRVHTITLMNSLLPGLDKNDTAKCMYTFQMIGVLVNLIPLVDCSEAVHLRADLNEDEKELCSATANFESIVAMFMDKLLSMLSDSGETAISSGTQGTIAAKTRNNLEDLVLHRGTISIYKGICRNSSTDLYMVAVDRFFSFLSENVFNSKITCDAVADMVHVSVKCYPEKSFYRFFKLIHKRIQATITPDSYTEEEPDFQILWWLAMAAKVVKVPSSFLLEHWTEVESMLELVSGFKKANLATERSQQVLEHVLEMLCSVYVTDSQRRRLMYDKPLDEYLPIRNWAAHVDRRTWTPQWHIPSQQEVDLATKLIEKFTVPHLTKLQTPNQMNQKERLVHLWAVRKTMSGVGFVLPLLQGENIPLQDSPVFHASEHYVCKPLNTPELKLNGENFREVLLKQISELVEYMLSSAEDDVKSMHELIVLLSGLCSYRGMVKETYQQSAQNYRVTKVILSDPLAGNRHNIEMLTEEYCLLLHKKRVIALCGYEFKQGHLDALRLLLKLSTSTYSQTRSKAQSALLGILREHAYSYRLVLDDILRYLHPSNNSTHEQLKVALRTFCQTIVSNSRKKGALHLLVDGKRHSLLLKADFWVQLKVYSAVIACHHSEKPSIISLLETAQNTIVDGYESIRCKYEISAAARELAEKLLSVQEASPLNPLSGPSEDLIKANEGHLEKLSQKYTNGYYALGEQLLVLSLDTNLHWKHLEMAQALLSLLFRRDMAYPSAAVRAALRLCVSDSVKTRKMSAAVIASWLKCNKPLAVKKEYKLNKPAEVAPGAKWPIPYGFRPDNTVVMYDPDNLPTTDEEWNRFQFCGKQHWGHYTWPEKLITYAPLGEQTFIDRVEEDLNETEKFFIDTFRDSEFSHRLRTLYALEEKKGDDTFNAVNFAFFQGLFRCFNDILCPEFMDHIESLISSTKEAEQRLASEMIAGILNGAKLWKWERQKKMWAWLGPCLSRALETCKDDSLRNWGVCLATICGSSEARMLQPLIDILFNLVSRPVENAFTASSRLYLLQGCLCQFEWRGMALWNRFMNSLTPAIVQQYNNLRERIAICLVSSTWFDLWHLRNGHVDAKFLPPTVDHVISSYEQLLGSCWDETRLCAADTNGGGELSDVKKQSRLALKSLASFVCNQELQGFYALHPSVVHLLPLFFHFSNDVGDEELSKSVSSLVSEVLQAVYISPENLESILKVFHQVLESQCWWKAKVSLLMTIKVIIFSNSFIFSSKREELGKLLLSQLWNNQIEVREASANAFARLIQTGFFKVTDELVDAFIVEARGTDATRRHGGVLGLAAIALAHPYSVPVFLPNVLMKLCRFVSDKNGAVKETAKRALSEFKRTHQDSWREHESQFNEDQLEVLRGLLVSANYYV